MYMLLPNDFVITIVKIILFYPICIKNNKRQNIIKGITALYCFIMFGYCNISYNEL